METISTFIALLILCAIALAMILYRIYVYFCGGYLSTPMRLMPIEREELPSGLSYYPIAGSRYYTANEESCDEIYCWGDCTKLHVRYGPQNYLYIPLGKVRIVPVQHNGVPCVYTISRRVKCLPSRDKGVRYELHIPNLASDPDDYDTIAQRISERPSPRMNRYRQWPWTTWL